MNCLTMKMKVLNKLSCNHFILTLFIKPDVYLLSTTIQSGIREVRE